MFFVVGDMLIRAHCKTSKKSDLKGFQRAVSSKYVWDQSRLSVQGITFKRHMTVNQPLSFAAEHDLKVPDAAPAFCLLKC